MKYLNGTYENLAELKKAYYRLAKKLHPDVGGDAEEFKILNSEYEILSDRLSGKGNNSDTSGNRWTEDSAEFIRIVEELIKLDGINAELCGTWIWISGNTYQCKDKLKELGCKWASKKRMWYWKPADQPMSHSRGASMSYIRTRYGSQEIISESKANIRKSDKR